MTRNSRKKARIRIRQTRQGVAYSVAARSAGTPATPPSAQAAITAAVAILAPYPTLPDASWSTTALQHNFSREAELSAALVTLEHATISSPVHILLFHHGQFLGTATDHAQPGVHLLPSRSTSSVVTIEFREPGTPQAGPPTAIRTAWFQWSEDTVQWFGHLPPEVTSMTATRGFPRYFATTAHHPDLFECQAGYVHEGFINGSTVLRVQLADGTVDYVSGTRWDDHPLTWHAEVEEIVIQLDGTTLRSYPLNTGIRTATPADMRTETGFPL
jgi:hypothetical protein